MWFKVHLLPSCGSPSLKLFNEIDVYCCFYHQNKQSQREILVFFQGTKSLCCSLILVHLIKTRRLLCAHLCARYRPPFSFQEPCFHIKKHRRSSITPLSPSGVTSSQERSLIFCRMPLQRRFKIKLTKGQVDKCQSNFCHSWRYLRVYSQSRRLFLTHSATTQLSPILLDTDCLVFSNKIAKSKIR